MLYLVTGSNGAGKTLNTLKWIRDRSVKEGRPVCHNGRFEAVEGGELSSWRQIDIKDWQAEPDGTIFLVDECHNDFPLRPPSGAVPEYVRMLAEHRRRGFDFYLVTQHPQNIDSFVRRLIGSPGWHRHLKRAFGGDLVSVCEWPAVNPNCEKTGSGKSGTVTMQAFPKEVFNWYKSASLHTAKRQIPRMVWVLLLAVLMVPVLLYFAYASITKPGATQAPAPAAIHASAAGRDGRAMPVKADGPASVEDYLNQRVPRLEGFPHTAPVYDKVTTPTTAPIPAACISMGDKCKCYTQQGTVMQIAKDICTGIVKNGYFVDWGDTAGNAKERGGDKRGAKEPRGAASEPVPQVVTVPMPEPIRQQPNQITQADIPHVLALRKPSMAAYPPSAH